MFKSSFQNFKVRFAYYYILKSTAWITPVFFLFLQKEVNLDLGQILRISGSLMILPFVLDIPLGILADRIGAKILLAAGTCLQFFSLLGFFILPSTWAYMSYLVAIIIAENCYSGAEQSFLHQNLKNTSEVKEYLKKLNQYFYYTTIPGLITGVLLFQINSYYPLYMQLLSFFAAFVIAIGFKVDSTAPPGSQKNAPTFRALEKDVKSILPLSRVVGLILVSIVFASIVQITAKGIQGQIEQWAHGSIGLWLGVSYVFGNFASGTSILLWRKIKFVKTFSVNKQLALCFSLFFCALTLMVSKKIVLIAIGFVLLSAVKSVYRPLISGELIHSLKDLPRMATKLSIVSTITTMGVAGMHVLSGVLLNYKFYGPLTSLFVLSALFGLAIWTLKRPQIFTSFSGKTNEVLVIKGVKYLKQSYPAEAQIPDFKLVEIIANNWAVSVPKVKFLDETSVTFEYIEHQVLTQVSKDQQLDCIHNLLNHQNCDQNNDQQSNNKFAKIQNGLDFLNFSESQSLLGQPDINTLRQRPFIGETHGDLNPHNILVSDRKIYLVDWDLCAVGYTWSDGLALITHPQLDLSIDERIEIFDQKYHFSDQKLSRRILTAYCTYKALRLPEFNFSELKKLATAYQKLSIQMKGV